MANKPIIVVQGAQWGSEGKGMVAAALCKERNVHYAVRTGAINAGHTVYPDGHSTPVKMQQLPTGWVNPDTKLIVGPGALVHPETLEREMLMLTARFGVCRDRVFIDHRAGLHTKEHIDRASVSGRHHAIGATGKGCSEALVARVRNRGNPSADTENLFRYHPLAKEFQLADTVAMLNNGYDNGEQILLEGTQGSHLDLYLGPYPYTTHKPCQASTWIQEAGLSPALEYEVVLVARTYPIRVAGNSGPMPGETNWPLLAQSINHWLVKMGKMPLVAEASVHAFVRARYKVLEEMRKAGETGNFILSECDRETLNRLPLPVVEDLKSLFEFTTVTNKLRRIAAFDADMVLESIRWNRPKYLVLSFLNYWLPELWNLRADEALGGLSPMTNLAWLHRREELEAELGVPIHYVTTGPRTENFIRIGG